MKNYRAIGKIGEGTFSEVMKMQSLRDGNYYACKQMKQRFDSIEQVNNLREIQALRRLNPHPNILTLHEVVFDRKSGSLALMCELMDMNIYELIRAQAPRRQDDGQRGSQSRAMSFDFPFKKGSGIPLSTATLSPHCLSLLHAMVAYDPDDRVTAHQALQHPYFQEQRAAERQALAGHRRAFFPERPAAPELLSSDWHLVKEGRKQQQPAKPEEDQPRRAGPAYLMELPKLKLPGVTTLSSYSSPALQTVFGPGASGRVSMLRPLKLVGANHKADPQKDLKPSLKQCRLPTIERKGGGR
ncbi:PREDICTED: MAPK/MAK/MRK overlapping kinase [Condylura cristata]|uniref:MAPK/MAK/MRK overlapping kinase n=1 Tax=Condylura cristata TaxID=143302 RepID=UPI0003346BF7|nr:PREDICTED: MAPK/MAK/MRK overlapping kinase [Condylura cristata]